MAGHLLRLIKYNWDPMRKATLQETVLSRKVSPEEAAQVVEILGKVSQPEAPATPQTLSDSDALAEQHAQENIPKCSVCGKLETDHPARQFAETCPWKPALPPPPAPKPAATKSKAAPVADDSEDANDELDRGKETAKKLFYLATHPGESLSELAAAFHLKDADSVFYAVNKLKQLGMVEARKEEGKSRQGLFLTAKGMAYVKLKEAQVSAPDASPDSSSASGTSSNTFSGAA